MHARTYANTEMEMEVKEDREKERAGVRCQGKRPPAAEDLRLAAFGQEIWFGRQKRGKGVGLWKDPGHPTP